MMPSKSARPSTSRAATMGAPIPPVVFPSGGFVSPATRSDESDDDTSDSPFFSNAEMELRPPTFDRDAEAAYQADDNTAGFPGPYAYQTIVYEYLKGLSSKKREKALLNVTMYSAVMYVLNNPKDTSFKTAQFRFWAKKMFCLTEYEGDWVLTHDGKPVACREQMHGVLKHCHAIAGHGGRDKTSAEVRKFYSWIPKEIVARFVQMCPSCKSKRTLSSAALGVMTGPQTFFCNLQNTEQKLAQGKAISLAQARAHAQSVVYARNNGISKPSVPIGRGRVHAVGTSQQAPLNAINYTTPAQYPPPPTYHHTQSYDQAFGQADFFHPPQHPVHPAMVSRSVSFDDSSSRHYQPHITDARRVSAPALTHHYPGMGYSPHPQAAQWPQHAQETQHLTHTPAFTPMPLPQEADFDSLGDVRQACGSSAKQSLEEQYYGQHHHQYSESSQIDPNLNEYAYNPHSMPEYQPVHEPQFDPLVGGHSEQHYTQPVIHTAQPNADSFDPKDLYNYANFDGDHDSPLSVNELEFTALPDTEVPLPDDDDEVFPAGLREALHEFAHQEMMGTYA